MQATLKIAKQANVCFKIGLDYFIDDEDNLIKAINNHSALKIQN